MNPSKSKGDRAELEIAGILTDRLGWPVKRALGAGRAEDTGDLFGIPETCIQVKNYADTLRAINEAMRDLPRQQAHAGTTFAAAAIRRRGGAWMFVLDVDQFCALLREALS